MLKSLWMFLPIFDVQQLTYCCFDVNFKSPTIFVYVLLANNKCLFLFICSQDVLFKKQLNCPLVVLFKHRISATLPCLVFFNSCFCIFANGSYSCGFVLCIYQSGSYGLRDAEVDTKTLLNVSLFINT